MKYAPPDVGKYEKISQALLAAFPSQEDLDVLIKTSKGIPLFCHKTNIMSHSQQEGEDPQNDARLAEIPSPRTHPILVAKQMLTLASLLVHFSPQQMQRLSEHPHAIGERLTDKVISLVTSRDELLGTMEALE
jgi:hypothetical protein